MPDYRKAKIYKLLNSVDAYVYVGSTTTPLSHRMGKHRSDCKCNAIKQKYKLYVHMTKIGVDSFYIELLENYPCSNKEELTAREGQLIREMGTLNKKIEGRTEKEYYQDNIEKEREKGRNNYKKQQTHILEYIKQRCTCECGTDVNIHHISRHRETVKHKQLMEQLNLTME